MAGVAGLVELAKRALRRTLKKKDSYDLEKGRIGERQMKRFGWAGLLPVRPVGPCWALYAKDTEEQG